MLRCDIRQKHHIFLRSILLPILTSMARLGSLNRPPNLPSKRRNDHHYFGKRSIKYHAFAIRPIMPWTGKGERVRCRLKYRYQVTRYTCTGKRRTQESAQKKKQTTETHGSAAHLLHFPRISSVGYPPQALGFQLCGLSIKDWNAAACRDTWGGGPRDGHPAPHVCHTTNLHFARKHNNRPGVRVTMQRGGGRGIYRIPIQRRACGVSARQTAGVLEGTVAGGGPISRRRRNSQPSTFNMMNTRHRPMTDSLKKLLECPQKLKNQDDGSPLLCLATARAGATTKPEACLLSAIAMVTMLIGRSTRNCIHYIIRCCLI